jgi:Flp pilus assembly protein TadG
VNSINEIRAETHKVARPRSRRGQATVEFALVLLVLLALLYGILEVSRLVFINADVQNAAREAAQYVSLHATDPTVVADAKAKARSKITWADPNQVDFTASFPDGLCTFCKATVIATYSWTSIVNFVPDVQNFALRPLGPIRLDSTSTVLIENGNN